MKPFYIFVVIFLVGISSVCAQDLIILRDGNVIEAKVMEISPSEIRYKRFDNQDGPIIILPIINVLSIRYENGVLDIFNSSSIVQQETRRPINNQPPMNPNELNVGINIEPSGFALYGPSFTLEFTKNHWNNQINLRFPSLGLLSDYDGFAFGIGYGLNYFWYNRIGGFYLGALIDLNKIPDFPDHYGGCFEFNLAVNTGFRFVLPSGIYFNTGCYFGLFILEQRDIPVNEPSFSIRPVITFGYNFK